MNVKCNDELVRQRRDELSSWGGDGKVKYNRLTKRLRNVKEES